MKREPIRRKKAAFGADGAIMAAATLSAAGMQVAGQMAAAKEQSRAAIEGAKEQARSIQQQANIQRDAMLTTNQNNVDLQTRSMELTRELYNDQKQQQRDIQTNLQLLAGTQDTKNRARAAMQQYKYGGSAKRKFSLRGSNNMDFSVTDGGYAKYVYKTPEGFDLYKFIGDKHEESHELPNGKPATGIGIKFKGNKSNNNKPADIKIAGNKSNDAENADAEVEGGEYGLVTPYSVLIMADRDVNGFNTSEAIEQGMNPVYAFATQENNKAVGKRRLSFAGGSVGLNPAIINTAANINNADVAAAIASQYNPNNIKFKYGGKASSSSPVERKKADKGFGWYAGATGIGAGLGILGNYLSYNNLKNANNEAAKISERGVEDAANALISGYNQLRGIDPNLVSRENYAATHVMPATRSYQVSAAPKKGLINRIANRTLRAIKNNSVDSASMLSRMGLLEEDRVGKVGEADNAADLASEQIKQENIKAINQATYVNAELDAEANKRYTEDMLEVEKYNVGLKNDKALGIANARANQYSQIAGIEAGAKQANAQSLGNLYTSSAGILGNALGSVAKNYYDRQMAIAQMTDNARNNYIATYGTQSEIEKQKAYWENYKDNAISQKEKDYAQAQINILNGSLKRKRSLRNPYNYNIDNIINDNSRDDVIFNSYIG